MTYATGTGGTIGGPPTPLPNELDATAARQNMAIMLGITPESVIRPFEDLGLDATWKYKSSAGNPTIAMLTRVRTAGAPLESDKSWTAQFEILFKMLPVEVQARLISESKLPADERNAAYSALDGTLGATAFALAWLDAIANPLEPTALATSQLAQYAALPALAREQLVEQGVLILGALQNNLAAIGPNDPNFDALSGLSNRMGVALNDFAILSEQGDKAGLSDLAAELDSMQAQSRFSGDALQAQDPMLWAMDLIVAASGLQTAAPALLLGLSVASLDVDKTLLPASLTSSTSLVSEALLATLLPLADTGSSHLLPLLLNALFGGATALGSMASPDGVLGLDLGLNLGASAGVIRGICLGIAQACGANETTEATAADLLSGGVIAAALRALGLQNPSAAAGLVESLRDPLMQWLGHLEQFVTDPKLANIFSEEDINALNVVIQQGRLALENMDFNVFLDALSHMAPAHIEEELEAEKQKEEFRKFDEFVKILWRYTSEPGGNETSHSTGILQG